MTTVRETRITRLFARLGAERGKAFIAYITAGDPSPAHTASLVRGLERAGVDLVELGVPFSDPIADGPVIQRASDRALRAGMTVARLLDIVCEIRRTSGIPLLLFSYLNPLLQYGFAKLAQDAAKAGVDGALLTDLPIEEAPAYAPTLRAQGLDTVFLAAPTSNNARLHAIAEHSSGFIYLLSRLGTTGERASFSGAAAPLAERLRRITNLPLAVGFGIATPEHVREAAEIADGIVVGSAIVSQIERAVSSEPEQLAAAVEKVVHQMLQPLRGL